MPTATPPDAKKPVRSSRPEQVASAANGAPAAAPAERDGFKKTKVGWIPEDWKMKKIGSIGEVVTGGTPKTSNASYWSGEVVWATPTDVTALSTRFLSDTERKLTEKGVENSAATLLPAKSVIVCTRATIGDAAINDVPAATNQGFKSIVPDEAHVDTNFLYYSIETQKRVLMRLGCGSTFLEVSKKDFGNLKLPFPPLPEQRRIAAVLAAWDRALAQTGALLDAKQRRKKALMQQLLTGKTRLPEFGEQKPVRSSRPAQVSSPPPREWQEVKLQDFASRQRSRREATEEKSCKCIELKHIVTALPEGTPASMSSPAKSTRFQRDKCCSVGSARIFENTGRQHSTVFARQKSGLWKEKKAVAWTATCFIWSSQNVSTKQQT